MQLQYLCRPPCDGFQMKPSPACAKQTHVPFVISRFAAVGLATVALVLVVFTCSEHMTGKVMASQAAAKVDKQEVSFHPVGATLQQQPTIRDRSALPASGFSIC